MEIRNVGSNPNVQHPNGVDKIGAVHNSETEDVSKNLSAVINKYSKQLSKSLKQWAAENKEMKALLDKIPDIGPMIKNLSELKDLLKPATKTPPQNSNGTNTIGNNNKTAVQTIYNIAKNLPEDLAKSIKINSFQIAYVDADGHERDTTFNDAKNLKDLIDKIKNLNPPLKSWEAGHITIKPEDASSDINELSAQQTQIQQNFVKIVQDLQPKIASIQNEQEQTLFQTLYSYSSLRNNERSLSSMIKSLKTIAESGINSMKQ